MTYTENKICLEIVLVFIISMLAGTLTFAFTALILQSIVADTGTKEIATASSYDYTINGEGFQYATYCFTENGNLICDAEDGTRLYVDSYTPIYYER